MSEAATRELFRPVGLKEWRLIEQADRRAFPPRLPHQPIFYPVLNEQYAIMIARDWNCSDINSDYVGLVTAFDIDEAYVARFPPQVVGGRVAQELWVPAAELGEFNSHIVGKIRLLHVFYGEFYSGPRGLGGFP